MLLATDPGLFLGRAAEWWTGFSALGIWIGAVGTVGVALLALRRIFLDRPKLGVRLHPRRLQSFMQKPEESIRAIVVSMWNDGGRPISPATLACVRKSEKRRVFLRKTEIALTFNATPKRLEPGDRCSRYNEWLANNIDDVQSISVYDATRKRWKVSRWELWRLKRRAKIESAWWFDSFEDYFSRST